MEHHNYGNRGDHQPKPNPQWHSPQARITASPRGTYHQVDPNPAYNAQEVTHISPQQKALQNTLLHLAMQGRNEAGLMSNNHLWER